MEDHRETGIGRRVTGLGILMSESSECDGEHGGEEV